ncbi:MAG: Universal stress protein [Chthoniobacteraceae bacterium]|nr:Universal stress protein [Chthoniobacteraceae bacterium]
MIELNARPILCGTDFSEPAQHAANVAVALAKRLNSCLVLAHGVDERGEIPRHYWPRFMAADRPQLKTEAARLCQLGAEVTQELVGGVPDEGVVKCADKAHARLIVLGSGGKGALDRWVLGSAAERIAQSASVPVLIVRDPDPLEAWARGERLLKVFVGADFTPVADSVLKWMNEMRQIAPCEITLGFIDRLPEERAEFAIFDALNLTGEAPEASAKNEDDLRAKAEHWLGVEPVILRVAPGSARVDVQLLQMAKEAQADLLVVGSNQWRGLSRLSHASVSRRILRNAHTNVACVPSRIAEKGGDAPLPEVRRVLVATDLSEHGGRAIPYAYSVIGAGGMVRVVHVINADKTREPILNQLREMVPEKAAYRDVQTEVEVIESRDVAGAICEAADRFDADLLCIGSHGSSGLLAAALGSVAHGVLARSCRPVLVVRPPCS